MTTLTDTLAALEARARTIPDEIHDLRQQRGTLALQATLDPSKVGALDKLDTDLETLEREQRDVLAAIEEAQKQIQEAKGRGKIEASRKAVKAYPAAVKRVTAAYGALADALENLSAAVMKAKAAERQANDLADECVPFDPDAGDIHTHGTRMMTATDGLDALLVQAASTDQTAFPWTIRERLTAHVDTVAPRVMAEADIRQQTIEQQLHDGRAGVKQQGKGTLDPAAIKQAWPRGQVQADGRTFVDAYAPPPAA
ncbi:MAG: hypothetical protein GX856_12335 [Gammaproteobacteria bacterium]|nr:hypothetical protein [Gammaproteobacteria bacterium]